MTHYLLVINNNPITVNRDLYGRYSLDFDNTPFVIDAEDKSPINEYHELLMEWWE